MLNFEGLTILSIIYTCRYCKHKIGRLNHNMVTTSMLGLDNLTIEEKKRMIHYEPNGELNIIVICESCEESLTQHPNYHELDFFIH